MANIRPNPTNLEGFTDLDVRVSPKTGRELADEIIASVEHSQLFITTTLPDRLIVTQKQFASLNDHTEEMYHTTDRMFMTPLNVMEVVIDREYDTVLEVEAVMQASDELDKQRQGTVDNPTDEAKDNPLE